MILKNNKNKIKDAGIIFNKKKKIKMEEINFIPN